MLFRPNLVRHGSDLGAAPSLPLSAPDHLYLPQGEIRYAHRSSQIPYAGQRGRSSAVQKAGLAYQKKADAYCSSPSDQWRVVSGPWFCFGDDSLRPHYCQPDLLLDDASEEVCVVVEVKLAFSELAWWQLRRLYEPVLSTALPTRRLLVLALCRSYDPSTRCPEPVHLCKDLMDAQPEVFNVLVWRP